MSVAVPRDQFTPTRLVVRSFLAAPEYVVGQFRDRVEARHQFLDGAPGTSDAVAGEQRDQMRCDLGGGMLVGCSRQVVSEPADSGDDHKGIREDREERDQRGTAHEWDERRRLRREDVGGEPGHPDRYPEGPVCAASGQPLPQRAFEILVANFTAARLPLFLAKPRGCLRHESFLVFQRYPGFLAHGVGNHLRQQGSDEHAESLRRRLRRLAFLFLGAVERVGHTLTQHTPAPAGG